MSLQYGDVPPGGIQNIPPSILTGMLYRVTMIQGISKQTLKLVPLSGQISVSQQGKILFLYLLIHSLIYQLLNQILQELLNTVVMVQLLMLLIMCKKHIFHVILLH